MKSSKIFLLSLTLILLFSPQPLEALLSEFVIELNALSELNRINREALYTSIAAFFGAEKSTSINQTINSAHGTYKQQLSAGTPLSFEELPGMPDDLTQIIDFFKNNEQFERVGARMPKGILLYGPPGTGKTAAARVIAQQAGAAFFERCASQFIEVYVGVGPQRVRELFDQARAEQGKSVIFIDEIDAIGGPRDSSNSNSEHLNTLNELLNQMDGFSSAPNILVVAATNRIDKIDKALLRPGRFDRLIYIGPPNLRARKDIITYYCSKIPFTGSSEVIDTIATRTDGWTGAQLKNMVNEAAIKAAQKKASVVTGEDLLEAFQKVEKRPR